MVDFSVLQKLIRKVEFLDLSYNQLSSVENLQVQYVAAWWRNPSATISPSSLIQHPQLYHF